MRKSDIIEEKLDKIQNTMTQLIELFNGFKNNFHPEPLIKALDIAKSSFIDLHADTRKNINVMNLMTNELKGVVAMSRAALDEGRKFTQLIELPRLLDAWSEQYQTFIEKMHKLDKKFYDMDIQVGNLIFMNEQVQKLIKSMEPKMEEKNE